MLTLQSATQQSAKGAIINAPLFPTQQPAEGHFTNAPLYQPQFGNMFLSPDATTRFNQQLYVNRARTAAGHRDASEVSAAAPDCQQSAEQLHIAVQPIVAGQQPVTQPVPAPPSTQQLAKKKAKMSSESISEKTKNSQSKRRGSIVKSIDKLASSIATDETNSAAAASSSSMMPMFLALQRQQQAQQQQLQQQLQFQQSLLQRDVEMQIRGVEAPVKGQGEAMMKYHLKSV